MSFSHKSVESTLPCFPVKAICSCCSDPYLMISSQIIKSKAAGLLQDSDWYVIRKADAGTAVPSSITNFRAAVRTKAGQIETAIGNADTVDKLAALYVYTEQEDKSVTRPLGEWPKLEDY